MNILLLRGLSREQRHWGKFPGILAARVEGARVFCLDLPGAGTENQRQTPANVPAIMEDVRRRWLELRAREGGPWCLFAMSLGGMVAMQWCADHPDDFARVILCNTSAANLSSPLRRMNARVLPSVFRALMSRDAVERERIILSISTALQTDLDPTARLWASFQADRPVSRMMVLRQLWAASRFIAPKELKTPALILAGAHDPLTDPSCPRRLAAHLKVPLETHPAAGHEMALDAPEWLAERVGHWIGTGPVAQRSAV